MAVKKVAVMVDGGHLRVLAKQHKKTYNPDFIEHAVNCCVRADEELFRAFYYDCAPYAGTVKLPVSGSDTTFESNDAWLKKLASKDLFAVRLGVLKFRGFKPVKVPVSPTTLTDDDFKPDFEQKGVDMRIGLDIAQFSDSKAVDRIILITNDTDCVPAMKYGRRAGLQIVLMKPEKTVIASELLHHSDFHRPFDPSPFS